MLKKLSRAMAKFEDNFPVLKIEEDLDDLSMANCKSAATQTALNHEASKKGSTSTIWTSEESILRSADTVDEDNKSTSSSACEETGGVMSSGKSGEFLGIKKKKNCALKIKWPKDPNQIYPIGEE